MWDRASFLKLGGCGAFVSGMTLLWIYFGDASCQRCATAAFGVGSAFMATGGTGAYLVSMPSSSRAPGSCSITLLGFLAFAIGLALANVLPDDKHDNLGFQAIWILGIAFMITGGIALLAVECKPMEVYPISVAEVD